MKNTLQISILGAALLVWLAGCSQPHSSTVLAKVGSREITAADFEREVQWRLDHRWALPQKQQLLEEMILRELRLQKARAAGLESDGDLRHSYESLLVAKLEERELMPRLSEVSVPAEEVQQVYQKEIARYTRPAKVRLGLLRQKIQPKMTSEQLNEIRSRMAEARQRAASFASATVGFGALASEYSDEQASRYRGGDVGWYDRGRGEYRWPTQVMQAAFAMEKNGEISDLIETAEGLYLVCRIDARPQSIIPLAQVHGAIQQRLLAEKRERLKTGYVQELKRFAPVQSYPAAFAQVRYPATAVAQAEQPTPPSLQQSTLSHDGKSRVN